MLFSIAFLLLAAVMAWLSMPNVGLVSSLVLTIGGYQFSGLALLLLGYLLMSSLTFTVYACDKRAAQLGHWRTKESRLHLLALCGGWPGALIAQQLLRHKSSKQPFKLLLWLTVLVNIVVYLGCLTPLASDF